MTETKEELLAKLATLEAKEPKTLAEGFITKADLTEFKKGIAASLDQAKIATVKLQQSLASVPHKNAKAINAKIEIILKNQTSIARVAQCCMIKFTELEGICQHMLTSIARLTNALTERQPDEVKKESIEELEVTGQDTSEAEEEAKAIASDCKVIAKIVTHKVKGSTPHSRAKKKANKTKKKSKKRNR